MNFARLVLAFTAIFFFSNLEINAQAAPPASPVKIGVVNSDRFTATTGGINRLVAALRTLETEFKPRRDEIAQLVTRFDTLQNDAVRTPTAAKRDQLQTMQVEITRKQEDARIAYGKRLAALTDPIRLSVFSALEAFAKQRGVDLLVDVAKFPDGLLLINQGAELTPAFIREYNTRNP